MSDELETCIFCRQHFDESTIVSVLEDKGVLTINDASKERGDTLQVVSGQRVHSQCRATYIHKRNIASFTQHRKKTWLQKVEEYKSSLRSSCSVFDFKKSCLFCGSAADESVARKKGYEFFHVRTTEFDECVKSLCETRNGDWAVQVYGRLCSVADLHAADAVYHQQCSVNFRTHKELPAIFSCSGEPVCRKRRCERPEDEIVQARFLKTMEFLKENEDKQTTISDVRKKLNEYLAGEREPYGNVFLKSKI